MRLCMCIKEYTFELLAITSRTKDLLSHPRDACSCRQCGCARHLFRKRPVTEYVSTDIKGKTREHEVDEISIWTAVVVSPVNPVSKKDELFPRRLKPDNSTCSFTQCIQGIEKNRIIAMTQVKYLYKAWQDFRYCRPNRRHHNLCIHYNHGRQSSPFQPNHPRSHSRHSPPLHPRSRQ